ncbi:right-handed parallel beta-helix repeat-containing protein [Thalassotalea sp. PLHSN55]|uniref:right-handed parallel beta-helix repeat-containing protein n=1 Tax=Thalassotalea sp. PLHSN55 TaxID=3435888 RepID=UPI003F8766E7
MIKKLHGTAEKAIEFIGDPSGEKAVIGIATNHRDMLEIKHSSYIFVSGFAVINATRAGIRVNNSHNVKLNHNEITQSGVWGIFTNHANHFSAQHNIIIGPAQQHGIYHSNSGDRVYLANNMIRGFNGCGIHINADKSMGGATDVIGDGIVSNVIIENNYLSENGSSGGSAINLDGVLGVKLANNIMLNNKAAAISLFKQDGAIGSGDSQIINNLVIMPERSRWAVNIKKSSGGNHFENNIIVTKGKYRGIFDLVTTATSTAPNFSSKNNLYSFQRNFAVVNNKQHYSLSKWQQTFESSISDQQFPFAFVLDKQNKLIPSLKQQVLERKIIASNPYKNLIL